MNGKSQMQGGKNWILPKDSDNLIGWIYEEKKHYFPFYAHSLFLKDIWSVHCRDRALLRKNKSSIICSECPCKSRDSSHSKEVDVNSRMS
jgi:hypothetical protein